MSRLLVLLMFCVTAIPAASGQSLDVPSLPGWSSLSPLAAAPPSGVTLPGRGVGQSAPLIADLDNIPSNGLESAFVTVDGIVNVVSSSGSLLWAAPIANAPCGTRGPVVLSSPAAADLFGNGTMYVVIGYGAVASDCPGGVATFRGSDGQLLWDFNLRGFAAQRRFRERFAAVVSTPALADSDRDGIYEVAFGALDRNVYLLNADGSVRWYYNAADTVFSSPAFTDVQGDGILEVIIGTDISRNGRLRPATRDGGLLYALRTTPLRGRQKRHPFRSRKVVVWMRYFDQVLQSSPVISDVDPASPGEEIVIASGCYFPRDSNAKRGKWVKVIRPKDGRVLRTLDLPSCATSSAAAADLDNDGIQEIVAIANGAEAFGGDGRPRLMAWTGATGALRWEVVPLAGGRPDLFNGQHFSPLIADLDGTGSLEVILPTHSHIGVFDGVTGTPLTCQGVACAEEGKPQIRASSRVRSTPAIADVNRDGILDLVAGGGSGEGAALGYTSLRVIRSRAGSHPRFFAPWPQWRVGAVRQGR